MTSLERRWRDSLLAAIIPGAEGGRLQGLATLDLDAFWARFRSMAPLLVRVGFRFAVVALCWLPLFRYGKPFHRLSADTKDRYLQAVSASSSYSIRQLVAVVKVFACFAYFQDPGIQATVRGAR